MRVMIAAGPSAVVTAGSTRWRSTSSTPPSPAMSVMPETGSQRSRIANSSTRIRPSQNGGVLPASSVSTIVKRSKIERARSAANSPAP